MNIRRTTCLFLLGVVAAALRADAQEVKWIHHMAANFFSFGNAATADADGNFYITGYFGGDLDFGGVGLTGAGLGDSYIAKYNSQRALQWVKVGTSDGWNGGRGIAIGADGSVTNVGRIEGVTSFDGKIVTGVGDNDVFVARYSSSGAIQWVKSGGGVGADWANGVAVDAQGNSYAVGYYTGSAAFGSQNLLSTGDHDIFIVSYDVDGVLRWVKSAGGSGVDEGYGVAVGADGSIYVTGIVTGNATFSGTSFSGTGITAFLAKYSSDGTVQWVKGGSGNSTSETISINSAGEIFIAGSFSGTVSFGSKSVTSAGMEDIFVARYDATGTAGAAWSYGGTGEDGVAGFGQSIELVAAKDGGFYLTSSYENTMTLGPTTLQSLGMADIFVAQFTKTGEARWAISGGGTDNDKFVSLGVDGPGNAYLLGNYFSQTFKMGLGTLPRFSSVDMVMAKIDGSAASGIPHVSLSRNELNIGDVTTGESKTATLTISSGSNVPLTVSNIHFDDPQSQSKGFEIVSPAPDAFPVDLSGTQQLSVTVRFAPTDAGPAQTTLVVETNDPATPTAEVTVNGKGIDGSQLPKAVFSTQEVNIGEVWLGTAREGSLTISAGSAAGLVIDGIEFEDPASIDDGFDITSPTSFPITLNAGQELEVKIGFIPLDLGELTATLVISTNDASKPFKNIGVRALATEAPVAQISRTQVDFGDIEVGQKKEETLKITTGSGGALMVESIGLSETSSAQFRIVSPGPGASFPMKVNPGQEIAVTVEFAPLQKGSAQTTLTITTNDPQQPDRTATLSGVGFSLSGVAGDEEGASQLMNIIPNPLSSRGEIVLNLPVTGQMSVELIDITGRNIGEIYSGAYRGGEQRVALNAGTLPSGMYLCVVEVGGERYHRLITISR